MFSLFLFSVNAAARNNQENLCFAAQMREK
jgi:hypothetical protein